MNYSTVLDQTNFTIIEEYSNFSKANGTNTTLDNSRIILDNYNLSYAAKVFPAILFLFAVMGIGGVGNIVVCIVYLCNKRKSVNARFIISLATLDLVNCLLCIPAEIADLRYKATFGELAYICKGSRVLLAFSSTASCGVLVAIAIDRYKNICNPFSHQITLSLARTATLTCCVLAMCFSIPVWFLNGEKTFQVTNGTEGTDCSIPTDVNRIFATVYNGCLFFLFLTGCLTLVVLYTLIWKRLKIQERFRRAIGKGLSFLRYSKKTRRLLEEKKNTEDVKFETGPTGSTLTLESMDVGSTASPRPQRSPLVVSSLSSTTSSPSQSQQLLLQSHNNHLESKTTHRKPKPATKTRTPPRVSKTTFVMFLVTVLFVISFLPYLGLTTTRAINNSAFENLDGVNIALYHIFLRFHFLNSALNPVVYSFCGQQFRMDLKMLLRNLCCRY